MSWYELTRLPDLGRSTSQMRRRLPYMQSGLNKQDRLMGATKIATCCYCGTKAALVLRGKDRHELTCSNCGAPLRALKMLPVHSDRSTGPAAPLARPTLGAHRHPERQVCRPKKRSNKKGLGRRMLSGLWDVLEDVVDEVFD